MIEAPRKVYIETTVASYLTARPSGNLLAAAWQKTTSDWWETQRRRFDLYTSDVTLEEASRGDSVAAQRRLQILAGIPLLELTDGAVELAERLLSVGAIPAGVIDDALHVGVASVHGMDYLLTWNFRHLDTTGDLHSTGIDGRCQR